MWQCGHNATLPPLTGTAIHLSPDGCPFRTARACTVQMKQASSSLEEQCMRTVGLVMQVALFDSHWRLFGYRRLPRRGSLFNVFVSQSKLRLETILVQELLGAGVGQLFLWARDQARFPHRDRFLARALEIFVDFFGADVWTSLRFTSRKEVITHLFGAAREYTAERADDAAHVLVARFRRRLGQEMPASWAFGAVCLFVDTRLSLVATMPGALRDSGIANLPHDDLQIAAASFYIAVRDTFNPKGTSR